MSEYLGKYVPNIWDENNDVRYPKHFLKLLEEYSASNRFNEDDMAEWATLLSTKPSFNELGWFIEEPHYD